VIETAASLLRKQKSAGQCAYEKYCEVTNAKKRPFAELPVREQEAWSNAAVEAWKKIQEANTDRRFTT
jgi:hypothetical protein